MKGTNWKRAWEVAHGIENNEMEDSALEFPREEKKTKLLSDQGFLKCPMCDLESKPKHDGTGMRTCCAQCGLIFDVIGDNRIHFTGQQEVSTGNAADQPKNECINPLMPDASMSTDISFSGKLAYNQYQMIKLNRWSSLSPVERSMYVVFNKIEKQCSKHKVPTGVQYTAKWLFKRVYECNLEKQKLGQKREGLRGEKRDGLIGACVYMAFKLNNLYWTKTRVAMVFDIDLPEIRRGVSIFHELVKKHNLPLSIAKVTGCKNYIQWFGVGLGLSRGITTLCCKFYKELSRCGVGASKQPQSIAAGCLWIIIQELRPDIELNTMIETTGISKGTIKDVVRILGGREKIALITVFCRDMCEAFDIDNALTFYKIVQTGKILSRLGLDNRFTSWALACFAMYFVLTMNNVPFHEQRFLLQFKVSESDIVEIAKRVVFFREAIIESFEDYKK
jgi:transcription initiation factor TFIIIB Brf1 subunit/transcription initiation factor TFIIB